MNAYAISWQALDTPPSERSCNFLTFSFTLLLQFQPRREIIKKLDRAEKKKAPNKRQKEWSPTGQGIGKKSFSWGRFTSVKTNYQAIMTKYEVQREVNSSAPAALVQPLLPCEGDADLKDHAIMGKDQLLLLEKVETLFQGKLFKDFDFEEVLNSEEWHC